MASGKPQVAQYDSRPQCHENVDVFRTCNYITRCCTASALSRQPLAVALSLADSRPIAALIQDKVAPLR